MQHNRSATVRRINRRAAAILTATAVALATVMGLLAIPASAAGGPPAPPMRPVYDLTTGYWILHDWGVPGDQAQMTTLLVDTCNRMSNDVPTLTALQASLSRQYVTRFGGQGGNILAIASDTVCPQYQQGVADLAWFVDGARW